MLIKNNILEKYLIKGKYLLVSIYVRNEIRLFLLSTQIYTLNLNN